MAALTELTTASLRRQARRFIAPGIAVVIGVTFLAASLILGSSLSASVLAATSGDLGRYDAVVTRSGNQPLSAATVSAVHSQPGVRHVQVVMRGYAKLGEPGGDSFAVLSNLPSPTSKARLSDGHWPTDRSSIAVSLSMASTFRWQVGDRVTLTTIPHGNAAPTSSPVQIVGLVDAARDVRFGAGAPFAFGIDEAVASWADGPATVELDIVANEGVDGRSLVESLRTRLGTSVTVRTGTDQAHVLAKELTGGTDVLTGVLAAFASIALFVSMMVIANTFTILLARRRRETALLRLVGGSRGQLIGSALVEAAVVAVTASALGTAAGVGASAGLLAIGDRMGAVGDLTLDVPGYAIVVPFVVGVVATLTAAAWPVGSALRVSPLEALRPVVDPVTARRRGWLRLVLGGAILIGSGGLLAVAIGTHSVALGLAGGLTSFLGVLATGPVVIPALTKAVGRLGTLAVRGTPAAVPSELAVENAIRNPRRTAATASALLIGVTLVVTTLVGAASGRSSVMAAMDERYPVDLAVTAAESTTLPPASVEAIRQIPGIEKTAALGSVQLTVGEGGPGRVAQVFVVGPDAVASVRDPRALDAIQPGVLLTSPQEAGRRSLHDGQRVPVSSSAGSLRLRVVVSDRLGYRFVIAAADAARVGATAQARSLWLRLAPDADVASVMDDVRRVAPRGSTVAGAAAERARLDQLLQITLAVIAGLLAVSVVVALVGVANTLSLSALERTRELALVRALGLTTAQLRWSLALEGVLLAGISTLLAIVLGVGYGWAGAVTLFGGELKPVLDIPIGQLLAVAVVALVAGLAASVLPGSRAATVSPASALAQE